MRLLAASMVVATLMVGQAGAAVRGQTVTCARFPSQAEAQAAYRDDPLGLAQLDLDQDGYACESNRAPYDCDPVPEEQRRGPVAPPGNPPPGGCR
jgi:hypothetical protein